MTQSAAPRQTALVCLLPGLGDALAASNVLRRLEASGYETDVLSMLKPVAEYASSLSVVRNAYCLPLLTHPVSSLLGLRRLRSRKYDLCLVPFPATRWQYTFVASVVGAVKTVIHNYGGLASAIAAISRALQVKLRGGHRYAENERLADAARLAPDPGYGYLVPEHWRGARKIGGLLGMHTGTMIYKGNEARRWPFERFVELARLQCARGRRIRIFIGPNEREDEVRLRTSLDGLPVEILSVPLAEAVAALSECEVFVGNDAGFSHLAAAVDVKTAVLFGMTSAIRALPIGRAVAVHGSQCPPCHDEGLRGFDCVRGLGYRCLNEDLPVDYVDARVHELFECDDAPASVVSMGPYSLYGRRFEHA